MRKITFKAPASVWDYRSGDPDLPVKDPAVLKNYDGYVYEDECFDELCRVLMTESWRRRE